MLYELFLSKALVIEEAKLQNFDVTTSNSDILVYVQYVLCKTKIKQ